MVFAFSKSITSVLYFALLSPLHSDLPIGKSKRSLNLYLVLLWKTHPQQHSQGQKPLQSCFVIPSTCIVEKTTKRRDETTKVRPDRNWGRRVKIKTLAFFLMLPYKLERSHIFWYRILYHLKCQIEETCTTLQQVQKFTELPQYSHSQGSSTEDATVILPCVLLVSQTHFNQDRCHTKTGLKFYKLQMKKVSEKNASLLNNRSFVPNILSFKTFSKSEPRSQGFVPWDREQCGSLLGRTPTFSFEAASYARGFRQSATESGSQKPGMPRQRSQGSQALYVEQRGSLEDLGLAPRSCGSWAAPCRIRWSRHLCQLWDCLYGAQMNVRLISQLSVRVHRKCI